MMIHTRDLEGLPVVLRKSGKWLGRVLAVDCRPGEARIRGLIIEKNPPRCIRRYLPWQDIAVLGRKVIIAEAADRALPKVSACGSLVLGPNGDMMGFLRGFQLDAVSGRILHAELAVSLWEDFHAGLTLTDNQTRLTFDGLQVRYHPPETEEKDGNANALL